MNLSTPNWGWLPPALGDWPPLLQALTLGLATFVQEDVPTLTAALLAASGALSATAGFWGCFLGIWFGDLLLFGLARGLGRPVLGLKWVSGRLSAGQLAEKEAWFARRGTWLLISARMIPGTRLPTYLAAGLLRWPVGRFFAVTGAAALVWTLAWFGLAFLLGDQLKVFWARWHDFAWLPLVLLALGWGSYQVYPRKNRPSSFLRPTLTWWSRWLRWEFWPAWLFYPPVVARYIYLSIRHRSFTLPSAANPGIAYGGLVGESKIATLKDLSASSPEFTAEAWYLPEGSLPERISQWKTRIDEHQLGFPHILKPDLGQRGLGVKCIRSQEEAIAYLKANPSPLILQRYVAGPLEAGIFYYRFPGEERGHIFAVTEKIFPAIIGDGQSTIEELIWSDKRARFMANRYLSRFADRQNEVLASGKSLRLVEAGNHAQGCIFRDGAHLATPALAARIDEISRRIPGFHIGRYDVRYADEMALAEGRDFKILELNGAAAEATNIYDARYSVFRAYQILFRQWALVFEMGSANRALGHRPCAPAALLRAWRDARALFDRYPLAD